MTTADQLIHTLGLAPHPEGGWFVETWREPACTAIYFLLRAGERSHWHRVDRTEVWHLYAGGPLVLSVSVTDDGPVATHVLGTDVMAGQRPQAVVPAGAWQAAAPADGADYALVGCTVAPAFAFEGFELAPPDWRPGP